ncbi:hypothetical protein [Streptomyces sp. NBC_01465]|uniref:hypothetical protein n=1 Tax=Streptomyces sp. NBC_01465 TaxID=2903878 RepID=UPI002E32A938|nr:hypothetical protein [Streptomyces sp. NBC_01465]
MPEADVTPPGGEDPLAVLAVQALDELVGGLEPHLAYPPEPGGRQGGESRPALRRLRVLAHLENAVKELECAAAREAAEAGAGYPQIGAASRLSRQGARRRWPGLVNDSAGPYTTLVSRSTQT